MAVNWVYWPSDPIWTDDPYTWETRPPWVRPSRPGTMRWALRRTVDSTSDAFNLDAAKAQLRVDFTDDDQYIASLISAAREYVEMRTGMALLPSTWQLVFDRWPRVNAMEYWPWPGFPPGAILLPRFPVSAVSSVVWYGADGSTNTVASGDYIVDLNPRPPVITPAYTKSWPAQSLIPKAAIVVTFTAGYADATKVPPTLLRAMALMVGHWYENREAVMIDNRLQAVAPPHAVDALLGIWQNTLVG